jgi:hypothetical protein
VSTEQQRAHAFGLREREMHREQPPNESPPTTAGSLPTPWSSTRARVVDPRVHVIGGGIGGRVGEPVAEIVPEHRRARPAATSGSTCGRQFSCVVASAHDSTTGMPAPCASAYSSWPSRVATFN